MASASTSSSTTVQLHEHERRAILARLDANERDATAACSVLEALYARAGPSVIVEPRVKLNDVTPTSFVMRVLGLRYFLAEYATTLAAASSRVRDIRLVPGERAVDIECARVIDGNVVREHRQQVTSRHPLVAVDYAAGGVTNVEDRRRLDAVSADVFNAFKYLPAEMHWWYEPLNDDDEDDDSDSDNDDDDDDDIEASMSAVHGEKAAKSASSTATTGYIVCIEGMPPFSTSLLAHLASVHAGSLSSMYMWFTPPPNVAASPLLVVNVRAAAVFAPPGYANRRLKSARPRGYQPKNKRAKRVYF